MNFILPLPPTKNQLHKIARGRMYLSKELQNWRDEAGYALLRQWKAPRTALKGKLYIGIHYILTKDRDLDSGEAIGDFLQRSGVIENDKQFYQANLTKEINKNVVSKVEIEIERLL